MSAQQERCALWARRDRQTTIGGMPPSSLKAHPRKFKGRVYFLKLEPDETDGITLQKTRKPHDACRPDAAERHPSVELNHTELQLRQTRSWPARDRPGSRSS